MVDFMADTVRSGATVAMGFKRQEPGLRYSNGFYPRCRATSLDVLDLRFDHFPGIGRSGKEVMNRHNSVHRFGVPRLVRAFSGSLIGAALLSSVCQSEATTTSGAVLSWGGGQSSSSGPL